MKKYYGLFIRASVAEPFDDLHKWELQADLVSVLRHYGMEPARNHEGNFVLLDEIPADQVEVL